MKTIKHSISGVAFNVIPIKFLKELLNKFPEDSLITISTADLFVFDIHEEAIGYISMLKEEATLFEDRDHE